jgi:hypothetical protein
MKKSITLGAIAVILLVLYTTTMTSALLPLCVVFVVAFFIELFRKHHTEEIVKPSALTVDDLTAEYGEPDDIILVNATRANEAMGVILDYKDFFVVEGRRIDKSKIQDVTFNNSGTPYTPNEYQVIIVTGSSQNDYIHINTGYDATWTKDVVELIKKNL